MTPLTITLYSTCVAAIVTFITNTALESIRNKNLRKLEEQKRIWDLKAPIYTQFAEEIEELFVQLDDKDINVKDKEKIFNKVCNKFFLVGNDSAIKQLNSMKGGPDAKDDVGNVLILLRKELNKKTELKSKDYKRKTLSISLPKQIVKK